MDHRLYKRIPVAMNVRIYRDGHIAAFGKARNLSRDGIFIETAVLRFPISSCTDIGVVAHKNGCLNEQRLHAIVVHQSDSGVGLMFGKMNDDTLHRIDVLLNEQSRQAFDMISIRPLFNAKRKSS